MASPTSDSARQKDEQIESEVVPLRPTASEADEEEVTSDDPNQDDGIQSSNPDEAPGPETGDTSDGEESVEEKPPPKKVRKREPSIRIVLNPTDEELERAAPRPIDRALSGTVIGQAILCGVLVGVSFLVSGFHGRVTEVWTVAVAVVGCVLIAGIRALTREEPDEEPTIHHRVATISFEVGAWALVGWSFGRISSLMAPEEVGVSAAVLLCSTFLIGELFRHSVRLRDDLGRALVATLFIGAPFFALVAIASAFFLEPDRVAAVAVIWGLGAFPFGEMTRWNRRRDLAPDSLES